MKVRLNTSIEKKKKDLVKCYADVRRILGEDITDGDILEEALDVYKIEERFNDAMQKVQRFMQNRK